jgi:hypothetical protein
MPRSGRRTFLCFGRLGIGTVGFLVESPSPSGQEWQDSLNGASMKLIVVSRKTLDDL